MVRLAVSTELSFTIDIATDLLVLQGEIRIHFDIHISMVTDRLSMILCIEATTNHCLTSVSLGGGQTE